ncbi:hypothetical protein GBAR_LOCUS14151 [Geodia barretti]|uniref:Uncharacterized protein n=1 Tax=Geodia barretti TaxID=519541 RepID=A0AA35S6H4_GEOBA|nr:hypothetical protein GBAR_LOCUS14151 [Geodia barretti]
MAEEKRRPGTGGQRPVGLRRAMSAIQRPSSGRPMSSARPRRPYSAYTKKGDEEESPKFEAPKSNREWWRAYLKETPIPGSYSQRGFLDDLRRERSTYRFRDTPRAKSASHQRFERTGEQLLPGAYETQGFVQDVSKRKVSYGFLDIERGAGPKIGHGYGDKELDTEPTRYNVVDYTGGALEKDSKTSAYRSRVKRDISSAHQFRIVRQSCMHR